MSEKEEEVGLGKVFTLASVESMVSHWFLHSDAAVTAVAVTPEWKDDHRLVARVTVNGVELPFSDLDDLLMVIYEKQMKELDEKYSDQARDASDLIEPYWDRQERLKSTTVAVPRDLLTRVAEALAVADRERGSATLAAVLERFPDALDR